MMWLVPVIIMNIVGLIFTFPVTLVLLVLALRARDTDSGREFKAQGLRAALLLRSPMLMVFAMWLWGAGFRLEYHGITDVAIRKATAGWRYWGLYVLFAAQAIVVVFGPLSLRAGRRAAWTYGAFQLWIGFVAMWMAQAFVLRLNMSI